MRKSYNSVSSHVMPTSIELVMWEPTGRIASKGNAMSRGWGLMPTWGQRYGLGPHEAGN